MTVAVLSIWFLVFVGMAWGLVLYHSPIHEVRVALAILIVSLVWPITLPIIVIAGLVFFSMKIVSQ